MHVEPPPVPLIKGKNNDKSDKYFVKFKFRRNPTSKKSDPYEFKMALFDNGYPEYFLLFIQNFNMTLKESGMLKPGANIQSLRTLVCEEALYQFDMFYDEVGSDNLENLKSIV